jgi:hypothetical protein
VTETRWVPPSKATLQLVAAAAVLALFALALVVAIFYGTALLRAVTPFATMVFGWLFTAQATER